MKNDWKDIVAVLLVAVTAIVVDVRAEAASLKALIVTGQSNHDWKLSTPIFKQLLEQTGLFTAEVALSPSQGEDMETFKPNFAAFDLVVLNYVGESWPEQTRNAFVEYVKSGGGVIAAHSACNAFPKWKEYNQILGLGGWYGRDEQWGPYVRWRDGKVVRDLKPGQAGSHPDKHAFQIINRDTGHPINRGLPEKWMHSRDGMNVEMRGPAENLTVLATAYADPRISGGTGEHEPMLFTVQYGKGRVFSTLLGHAKNAPVISMQCVGFIATFQRGAEWAATGKVTQPVPVDFPTATEIRLRPDFKPPPASRKADDHTGILWEGKRWNLDSTDARLFVNAERDLEWTPKGGDQILTRIPEQRLSETGDVVEMSYLWMSDGAHSCPDCTACPKGCYDDDITCIAGTSDMRVGLFESSGAERGFADYKGYNFRFGPNMKSGPTRWVDCTGEVHKTGNFAKKPAKLSNLMSSNSGLKDYIPGFELPPGQYSLFKVRLERTSLSSVKLFITLNGRTYEMTDADATDQPGKIDVFAISMRNKRPYTRVVLRAIQSTASQQRKEN